MGFDHTLLGHKTHLCRHFCPKLHSNWTNVPQRPVTEANQRIHRPTRLVAIARRKSMLNGRIRQSLHDFVCHPGYTLESET